MKTIMQIVTIERSVFFLGVVICGYTQVVPDGPLCSSTHKFVLYNLRRGRVL